MTTEYDRFRNAAQEAVLDVRMLSMSRAEVYASLAIAAALQDIAFALRGVPGWSEPNA